MLPREFDLYGSRIPLVGMSQPLPPEAVVWLSRIEANNLWFGKSGAGYVYRFENIGDFLIPSDGALVQAYVYPQAQPWEVDFVLSRGVIPRLLHLRGITCLHAGAVAVGERVVAFCGPSGSGKSTLTAALAARGYPVVTDDVLPLRTSSSNGAILAGPGLPEVRVHPSTAVRIGIADRAIAPVSGQTKSVWRPESPATSALPLAAIYILVWGGPIAGAVSLSPSDTLLSLLHNSFWLDPGETAALATGLTRISQVVRGIPVSRLSFEFSEAGFDLVERLISCLPVCQ